DGVARDDELVVPTAIRWKVHRRVEIRQIVHRVQLAVLLLGASRFARVGAHAAGRLERDVSRSARVVVDHRLHRLALMRRAYDHPRVRPAVVAIDELHAGALRQVDADFTYPEFIGDRDEAAGKGGERTG